MDGPSERGELVLNVFDLGRFVVVLLLAFATSCTHPGGSTSTSEPTSSAVAVESAPAASSESANAPKSSESPPVAAPVASVEACQAIAKLERAGPLYVKEHALVLTRILKPCVTTDGRNGFDRSTPWMAMGFPCSGGDGLIDWKGTNYTRPKMVAFILATDCIVAPSDPSEVSRLIRAAVGLPETTRLIAYNPFVVQYWEIPGLPEADTGFTVELRSDESIAKPWQRLLKGEGLPVTLFGRENAWVQGDNIYQVDAEIRVTTRNRFLLQVMDVKTLNPPDIEAVRQRCETLRPRRNCAQIF